MLFRRKAWYARAAPGVASVADGCPTAAHRPATHGGTCRRISSAHAVNGGARRRRRCGLCREAAWRADALPTLAANCARAPLLAAPTCAACAEWACLKSIRVRGAVWRGTRANALNPREPRRSPVKLRAPGWRTLRRARSPATASANEASTLSATASHGVTPPGARLAVACERELHAWRALKKVGSGARSVRADLKNSKA